MLKNVSFTWLNNNVGKWKYAYFYRVVDTKSYGKVKAKFLFTPENKAFIPGMIGWSVFGIMSFNYDGKMEPVNVRIDEIFGKFELMKFKFNVVLK